MSVKRRDLVRYLEQNGFALLREGGKHFIYSRDVQTFFSTGVQTLPLILIEVTSLLSDMNQEKLETSITKHVFNDTILQ